jgi:redox-sensitive bicupin YhaK (pirin superfamily)
MSSFRAISTVIAMPYHGFDDVSGAFMLRAPAQLISPFIGIDQFTMPQPFFGPHPHAGMSAVTVMLPEADGGFVNRDSLGDQSDIRPGDLHWTQAGRGMMHEEVPSEPGKAARGLQVFVNLASKHKQADPVAFHVNHEDMPLIKQPGGHARLIAGAVGDAQSPIANDPRWLTRAQMLDVTVEPGQAFDLSIAVGDNAFFVLYSGEMLLANQAISTPTAVVFEHDGAIARIHAGKSVLRGTFFSGTPIDEPMVSGGPFMGNTADDISNYKRAFTRGDMGSLSATHPR